MTSNTRKTRVLVCGEKWVAENCLEFLVNRADTDVYGIVAAPTDWQADLISWGAKRRIKVFVGNINDYQVELANMELDFIFSIQYRPLVKSPILRLPKKGCINLHFGLLPRYGGCYPIAWAILNNEKEAGATLHYMVENFDEGDVIANAKVSIDAGTTARSLFDSISSAALRLFEETYPALCRGEIEPQAQDLTKKLYYKKGSMDFEKGPIIHWDKKGAEIQRRICAFSFEPFQLPVATLSLPGGRRLKVSLGRTRLCHDRPRDMTKKAGQVIGVTDSGEVIVTAGDGESVGIGMLDGENAGDFFLSLGVKPDKAAFN